MRPAAAAARNVPKNYGIRLGAVNQGRNRAGSRDRLRVSASGDPKSRTIRKPWLAIVSWRVHS